MRHVVIIPARNEAAHIGRTLESILAQQERPDRIYVVDDGSTDATPAIIAGFAQDDATVIPMTKTDRGSRYMGGGVVETFNDAYKQIRSMDVKYVSKIDADVVLDPGYFHTLLDRMDRDRRLAIAGGTLFENTGHSMTKVRMPAHHVPGALKTMRKQVLDEMGGLLPILGWDIVDEVKVHTLGYRTARFEDLRVMHLRPHASAEGLLRGKAAWGRGAYLIGSHPLFVAGRGFYRMLERPYLIGGLAFWFGYLRAALRGEHTIHDRALVAQLRKEQLMRLWRWNCIQD